MWVDRDIAGDSPQTLGGAKYELSLLPIGPARASAAAPAKHQVRRIRAREQKQNPATPIMMRVVDASAARVSGPIHVAGSSTNRRVRGQGGLAVEAEGERLQRGARAGGGVHRQ